MSVKSVLYKNCKIVKWIYKECPCYLPLMLLEEGIQTIRLYLNIWVSAKVVDEIVVGRSEEQIIRLALLLVLLNLVLALSQWGIDKVLIVKRREVENGLKVSMARKSLTMDYQVLENAATQDLVKQIEEGENYAGGISGYCQNIAWISRCVFDLVYSVFALTPLFQAQILPEHGMADLLRDIINSVWTNLLVIGIFVALVYYMYRVMRRITEVQNKSFEHGVVNNRRFFYFKSYILSYAKGKSVRIYNMFPMIKEKMQKISESIWNIWGSELKQMTRINGQSKGLFMLCHLVSYLYVGLKVIGGAIGIGEITSIPTAPAIADAYYRLDGERRYDLPLVNTPYAKK